MSPDISYEEETRVNALRYIKADGVADDTDGLNEAAEEARKTKKDLYLPPGPKPIKVYGEVNFRFIKNLTIERTIQVGSEGLVVIGSSRSLRSDCKIDLSRVDYIERDQTNVALRVIGLKQAVLRIGMVSYIQFWADPTNDDTAQSISYNTIFMGQAKKLELYCRKKPDESDFGWITEMLFVGGDYREIVFDSDYIINQITFFKPCCEGGVVNIPIGSRISFLDARGERGTKLYFGKDSSRIIWEDSFLSNPLAMEPGAVVVEDLGKDNIVTTTFNKHYRKEVLASVDLKEKGYSGFYNVKKGFNFIEPKDPFKDIYDTGILPLSGPSKEEVYYEAVQYQVSRLFVTSDSKKSYRIDLFLYDSDKNQIDAKEDVFYSAGHTWSDKNKYLYSHVNQNETTILLPSKHSKAKYFRLKVTSGNPKGVFGNLYVSCVIPSYANILPLLKSKRNQEESKKQEFVVDFYDEGDVLHFDNKKHIVTSAVYGKVLSSSDRKTFVASPPNKTAIGDHIAVELSDKSTHWTTIEGITGSKITLSEPLPSETEKGMRFYCFRLDK